MKPVVRIKTQIQHVLTMIEIYEKVQTDYNMLYIDMAMKELNSQLEFLNALLKDLEE